MPQAGRVLLVELWSRGDVRSAELQGRIALGLQQCLHEYFLDVFCVSAASVLSACDAGGEHGQSTMRAEVLADSEHLEKSLSSPRHLELRLLNAAFASACQQDVLSVSCVDFQEHCGSAERFDSETESRRESYGQLSMWSRPDFLHSALRIVQRHSVSHACLCTEFDPLRTDPVVPPPEDLECGAFEVIIEQSAIGASATERACAMLAQRVRSVPFEHSLALLALGAPECTDDHPHPTFYPPSAIDEVQEEHSWGTVSTRRFILAENPGLVFWAFGC